MENSNIKKLLDLSEKIRNVTSAGEKKKLTRDEFNILLTAPNSVTIGSNFFGLPLSDKPRTENIKQHLKVVFDITDKESAIKELAKRKHQGCQWELEQFTSFWNDRPIVNLETFTEAGRENFKKAMAFAKPLYDVVKERGFLAWDAGESIELVRECYSCGYIDESLAKEIIYDFSDSVLNMYQSWEEYSLSYIAGGCYYMYRESDMGEELAQAMFDKQYEAAGKLFFGKETDVWNQYTWPEIKVYFPGLKEDKKLVEEDLGCLVSDRISVDGCKIGCMYREQPSPDYPDSGWRFFEGTESKEYIQNVEHISVVRLNTICNYDPAIVDYLNCSYGTYFVRDKDGDLVVGK